MTSFYSTPYVSSRTANAMEAAGINSVEAIIDMSDNELLHIPNIGSKSLMELRLAKLFIQNSILRAEAEFNAQGPVIGGVDREEDLRDMFAAYAMQPLLLVYDRQIREGGEGFDVCPRAYRIAESMLKARK